MDILDILKKSLPDLAVDLIPGAGIVRSIARAITGADDDAQAAARIEADPALQVEFQKAVLQQAVDLARDQTERLRIQVDEIRAENEALIAVNNTMQSESRSEHWPQYSWRPSWGFSSAAAFFAVCVLACVLAWKAVNGGDPKTLNMIPQLITAFAALFAIPAAILGIASWHRGRKQRAEAGEKLKPGLAARAVEALKGIKR